MTPDPLARALVRILADSGHPSRPLGAGFLITPNRVLTCAHVIADALDIPRNTQTRPDKPVWLDLPLLANSKPCRGDVTDWYPINDQARHGELEDIAILTLTQQPAADAEPVSKVAVKNFSNRTVLVPGFPAGYDDGHWISGQTKGVVGNGWVQLDNELGRHGVTPGFSGAPVWDDREQAVIGMIVSVPRGERSIAYMVPAATLNTLAPELNRQHLIDYYQYCIERWSDPRHALDQRFVRLTLLLDQGEDAQGPRWQEHRQFQRLRDVVDKLPDQALVLLGPPGSGKSTLLRHYELDQAQAALDQGCTADPDQAPLTLFVSLSAYKPDKPDQPLPSPLDWLAECWAKNRHDLPDLDTLLRAKRLTLLLDALNEIPRAGSEPVRVWKDFLTQLATDYPGNRVLFSCRSLDYSATLSSKDRPVPQVRIEPLTDEQVEEFINRYCPEHGTTLWSNLKDTPQLELLRLPYYLKLLVEQTTAGEVPEGRAALFTGFVRRTLRREIEGDNPLFQPGELLHARDVRRLIQARNWPPCALPEDGPLIPRLSWLAFEMQNQRSTHETGEVRIDYDTALKLLAHDRATELLDAGVALSVLEQDLGADQVFYVHQLMQEYFAARQLARTPRPELVAQEWRADQVTPSLTETLASLADSDPLPPLPGSGWEETTLLAAVMARQPETFIADLMTHHLPLAGRCAAQLEVAVSDHFTNTLRQALVDRSREPAADLRARIAAGLALGELGDPRFERCQGPHGDYLLPPLVEIPGGTYRIGSDEELDADEAPIHEVELEPFAIGRFPVTNAEWSRFMQAGGYEDERWWDTDEAQAWQRGETTAEGLKQYDREVRRYLQTSFDAFCQRPEVTSTQIETAEQWRSLSDAEFETLLNDRYPSGRQTQPRFWNDAAFNNPNQPVVGICWYEARAYCAWLSAQTGQHFRLPTEAEWEAAARRRQGRRYAWGEEFATSRCNTFKTHVRRTTPIGIFPDGDTPEGLTDLTGNIWDWTGSLYQLYPYRADDGRDDPAAGGRRVVRGGSWYLNLDLARAAYRFDLVPGLRHNNLGFRVVRRPPS